MSGSSRHLSRRVKDRRKTMTDLNPASAGPVRPSSRRRATKVMVRGQPGRGTEE